MIFYCIADLKVLLVCQNS